MALSEDKMRRLAFIKYLYNLAVYQSNQPEPLAASSILTFHDSVELFLALASEHFNEGSKKTEFMTYFELLDHHLPARGLAQRESMKRLNSSRVELKHNGTLPSKSAIEGFRASVTNFLQDNTLLVFKEKFDSISLLHLVLCEEARKSLEEAEKAMEQENREESICKIALAFEQLVKDYEKRKTGISTRSLFFFGEDLKWIDSRCLGVENDKFSDAMNKILSSIKEIQNVMKIISLGLDYRKYSKFQLFLPEINVVGRGEKKKIYYNILCDTAFITKEYCSYCFDFVIESALKLQEFDFDVIDTRPNWREQLLTESGPGL